MKTLKSNIWFLFKMVLTIGFLLSVLISVNQWNNVYNEVKHEQESLVKMASISINAHIDQYSMLLSTVLAQT